MEAARKLPEPEAVPEFEYTDDDTNAVLHVAGRITSDELFRAIVDRISRNTWGSWHHDSLKHTLEYSPPDGLHTYQVELDTIHRPELALDAIFRASRKPFIDSETLGDLIRAIETFTDLTPGAGR